MRTRTDERNDELRPEYDFAAMKGGVRGKYAKRCQRGTNVVLLEPDVARVFRDNQAVNEALRALIGAARGCAVRSKAKPSRPLHSNV